MMTGVEKHSTCNGPVDGEGDEQGKNVKLMELTEWMHQMENQQKQIIQENKQLKLQIQHLQDQQSNSVISKVWNWAEKLLGLSFNTLTQASPDQEHPTISTIISATASNVSSQTTSPSGSSTSTSTSTCSLQSTEVSNDVMNEVKTEKSQLKEPEAHTDKHQDDSESKLPPIQVQQQTTCIQSDGTTSSTCTTYTSTTQHTKESLNQPPDTHFISNHKDPSPPPPATVLPVPDVADQTSPRGMCSDANDNYNENDKATLATENLLLLDTNTSTTTTIASSQKQPKDFPINTSPSTPETQSACTISAADVAASNGDKTDSNPAASEDEAMFGDDNDDDFIDLTTSIPQSATKRKTPESPDSTTLPPVECTPKSKRGKTSHHPDDMVEEAATAKNNDNSVSNDNTCAGTNNDSKDTRVGNTIQTVAQNSAASGHVSDETVVRAIPAASLMPAAPLSHPNHNKALPVLAPWRGPGQRPSGGPQYGMQLGPYSKLLHGTRNVISTKQNAATIGTTKQNAAAAPDAAISSVIAEAIQEYHDRNRQTCGRCNKRIQPNIRYLRYKFRDVATQIVRNRNLSRPERIRAVLGHCEYLREHEKRILEAEGNEALSLCACKHKKDIVQGVRDLALTKTELELRQSRLAEMMKRKKDPPSAQEEQGASAALVLYSNILVEMFCSKLFIGLGKCIDFNSCHPRDCACFAKLANIAMSVPDAALADSVIGELFKLKTTLHNLKTKSEDKTCAAAVVETMLKLKPSFGTNRRNQLLYTFTSEPGLAVCPNTLQVLLFGYYGSKNGKATGRGFRDLLRDSGKVWSKKMIKRDTGKAHDASADPNRIGITRPTNATVMSNLPKTQSS
ncbi:expressed unknown protein [Seminavis robusta]|uniref:Uncharacterized protein n=1 Tax=Seminavis robusta TaxID=568900 RepID=A0A9N8DK36_9STRA|nr:expressed unknown protein [Seminavis robusta]|eukprot:Sro201_g085220.1 n/a (851) ;mRNA; f:78862-81548